MIQDKLLTIKKENVFDKGWALFTPYQSGKIINRNFRCVISSEVVKKITYAQSITLLLSEPCLSHKIVEELKWVNKYAKIYLTVKSKSVADVYSGIKFAEVKVNSSLSLNYIGIKVKDGNCSYFIEDGFQQTDDTVERLYSSGKEVDSLDFSMLSGADKVFVLGISFLADHDRLFDFCLQNKIEAYLVKTKTSFCKADYDKYVNTSVELIVADKIGDGVCVEKEGKLYRCTIVKGQFICVEVESFKDYISGGLFKNLKKKVVLSGEEIPSNSYVLFDGEVQPLKQVDCHIIERQVPVATMADFIEEKFDCSEVDSHNQYSAIAKCVEYRFTLIPPLFSNSLDISSIYDGAKTLFSEWKKCYTLPVEQIKKELNVFDGKQKLTALLQHINDCNETVEYIIGEYHYANYKSIIKYCKNSLFNDAESLVDYCCDLNSAISDEISGSQNSKIDEEIASYERTIREKESCIAQNIDVLQSKRRIEILKRKIEDLNNIKRQFSLKQSVNNSESLNEFAVWCNKLLGGSLSKVEEDSVSSIVNGKDVTKREQLNLFLQKWLKPIKELLGKLIDLLGKMEIIDVPEDYKVFECEGQRYIAINDLKEFEDTRQIQEKYCLQCVARR